MTNPFDVLEPGRPYFAGIVAGLQSPLKRYLMMPTVVHSLGIQDRPVSVLEIGSWVGTSALVWAEALDRFSPQKGTLLCVDSWDPYFPADDEARVENENYARMTRLAESGLAYQLFLHNARCGPASVPIRHFRGTSLDVLPYLAGDAFDIIYVDGNHAYEHARFDVTQAMRLVRDGGVICGDDLELQWHEVDQAQTRQFSGSDAIFDMSHRATYHPGVTRAVGELIGRVSSYFGFWAVRKAGNGFRAVDLRTAQTFVPSHLAEHYAAESAQAGMPAASAS
jgi:predicted O-methyltransferase YrrM